MSGLLRAEGGGEGGDGGELSLGRGYGVGRRVCVGGCGVGVGLIARMGCGVRGGWERGSKPRDGK